MANLFSITAPLLIRLPTGDLHVMAERFPHLHGLVYFDLFWHLGNPHLVVHVVEGIIKGDGPWKIGVAVVRVLGCHGTDGALARRFDNGGPISPRTRRTTQRARTSRPSRAVMAPMSESCLRRGASHAADNYLIHMPSSGDVDPLNGF